MADLVFTDKEMVLNSTSMPRAIDLLIYKGDFVEVFASIYDDSQELVNISSSTPKASIKAGNEFKNFVCSLTGSLGEVRIYLPSSVSKTLEPGTYTWDFQLTNSDGDDRTYMKGKVTVEQDVTP